MRRALTYVAPWAVATALAVSLSWLGVRDVLRHAIFDRPGPLPAVEPVIHDSPSPPPTAAVTPEGSPSPSQSPPRSPSPSASPSRSGRRHDPPSNVRSFTVRGGRAALQIMHDRVKLVSATPNSGYETRVSKNEGWLRVDFLKGEQASSIIATWHDGAPIVQIYEYKPG